MKLHTIITLAGGVFIGANVASYQAVAYPATCQQPPEIARMVDLIERMELKAVRRDDIGSMIKGMQ